MAVQDTVEMGDAEKPTNARKKEPNVFLAWSGNRSGAMAEALRGWIPSVIQAARPFMSKTDIEKGEMWLVALGNALRVQGVGILCVTPESQEAQWLNFEAGILSGALTRSRVTPYLLGIKPSEVIGPLSHFQAAEANEADTRAMLAMINTAVGEPLDKEQLDDAFQLRWPKLQKALAEIAKSKTQTEPQRDVEGMIEETLLIVRDIQRRQAPTFTPILNLPKTGVLPGSYVFPSMSSLVVEPVGQITFSGVMGKNQLVQEKIPNEKTQKKKE